MRHLAIVAAAGLAAFPALAAGRSVDLTPEDLDATGASDVAPFLQKTVEPGGVRVTLPCGVFLVAAAVELPGGTQIAGKGDCTVMKLARTAAPSRLQAQHMPGASGAQRSIFTNRAAGDSGIVVRNLVADGRDSPANGQLISFFRASDVLVERINFIGAGTPATQDGVSFVSSSHYVVRNNRCANFTNACYDNWGGDSDFQIVDNFVDGRGVLTYGVLVNGITTDHKVATTSNFVVRGNKIQNVKELGIGAYGLCSPDRKTCGVVRGATIEGNEIAGVSRYHGILVGNGSDVRVSRNVIRAAAGDGVRISAQDKGGVTRDILVEDNTIESASAKGAAVSVGSGADSVSNVQVQGNRLRGYARPVKVAPGASVRGDAE